MHPPQFLSELSLEVLLDGRLQDADWILEPSSITSVNFPGEGHMNLLDQDLSIMHDHEVPHHLEH